MPHARPTRPPRPEPAPGPRPPSGAARGTRGLPDPSPAPRGTLRARLALLTLATLTGVVSCGILGPGYNPKIRLDEDQRLAVFLDEAFQTRLDRSPEWQCRLGDDQRNDRWDDLSERAALEDFEIAQQDRKRLRNFRFQQLSKPAQLDYRLFEAQLAREIEAYEWRLYDYPVNQMRGVHASTPAFLINVHRIDDAQDAEAYVARLNGFAGRFDELITNLELREKLGVLPPRFVFPMVIDDCQNLLVGQPFQEVQEDCTLLADFRGKLAKLSLAPEAAQRLEREARRALLQSVGPAYLRLVDCLERQSKLADERDGAWKHPSGDAFYAFALRRATTTDVDAANLHDLGLDEVRRIHGEMQAICDELEYAGNLQEFFTYLRTDERFYYPNTDTGREAYLARAVEIVDTMRARLPELFLTQPLAPLEVRPVEAYRQASAGKAFYELGTPDGTRPGVYYANLFDMGSMPKYQMEALAYHEAIPGHHMQLSLAAERRDLPRFRRYASYTAYSEGWALYSEAIPKEIGFYEDPYSDFGRLAMELWRACRLVVDTGIHRMRWTRQEAIDYLLDNTPNPEGDCIKAVERYIVMPGQATAYKIGMLKIQALRARAEGVLGEEFDLPAFHDLILGLGPMPLDLLEEQVKAWISDRAP